MARPIKQGLEYFPLDVFMDDKVSLIEAEHGITGFAILIKMFQKIYSEGYFYDWTEKEQLLFSNRVAVDKNIVIDIINDCIKWGIFDKGMYEENHILTSKGIQERFVGAIYKRTKIHLIEKYLLINVNDRKNVVLCEVSDSKNSDVCVVSDSNKKQSRVEVEESKVEESKSKVEESKVEENSSASAAKLQEIEKYFCDKAKRIQLSGNDVQIALNLIKDKIPIEIIKQGIDDMVERKKITAINDMDTVKSLKYCEGRIRDLFSALNDPGPASSTKKGNYKKTQYDNIDEIEDKLKANNEDSGDFDYETIMEQRRKRLEGTNKNEENKPESEG